jgi:hypothetical protein
MKMLNSDVIRTNLTASSHASVIYGRTFHMLKPFLRI